MENDTKTCSKCGIEKFHDEFPKRNDREIGIHPQCKLCRRPYIQTVEGLAVAADKEIYNSLNAEGQGKIDKLATSLKLNLQKKIDDDPPKKLNLGSDSARHVIFALIRFTAKQEL